MPLIGGRRVACWSVTILTFLLFNFVVLPARPGATSESDEMRFKIVAVLTGCVYVGYRYLLDRSFLPDSPRLVVEARGLTFPAFILGQVGDRSDIFVSRGEIGAIWLVEKSKVEAPKSLCVEITSPKHVLEFEDGSFDTDLRSVARALESYLIKPCAIRPEELPRGTGHAAVAILLLMVAFVLWSFWIAWS